MGLVGEGEEFLVAATVAVGGEVVGAAIGIEGEDAVHLLLTIAVFREEAAREAAVEDFYLRAKDGDLGEEGLHPVVDRSADDQHVGSLGLGLLEGAEALGAQQLAVVGGKLAAEGVEGLQIDVLEEIGEDMLLRLPIRIEPQLHQHQLVGVAQEAQQEGPRATGIADKDEKGIAGGERTVEIEGVDLSHSGKRRLMIC